MPYYNLFAYGTLMSDRVLTAVTGRIYQGETAWLRQHARYSITGESYPGLIRRNHALTEGRFYANLSPAQIRILDRFEGVSYRRTRCRILLESGRIRSAEVYLYLETHRLTREHWSFERFTAQEQHRFINHYPGFRLRYQGGNK